MGLMNPSRKQTDFFSQRTGPVLRKLEKRESRVASATGNNVVAAATTTVIAVPSGYKATLLSYSLFIVFGGGTTNVRIEVDGKILMYFENPTTNYTAVLADKWPYEEGPSFYSTFNFINSLPTASSFDYVLSVVYAIEPSGEGWY